ncbi:cytochrome b [Dyella sp. ASV21]|jgi:cytochrome b561|uniref:cytochrome b n=1 Tax=Dyella sp. ASV21 TaxID=2795114 RepID=UPI0018EAEC58|nr:cytochrome b [Dyella sp. ASV21]
MNTHPAFHPLARVLHWTMAVLILAMLFIGVGMVSTVSSKHTWLLAIHKPLGIAILVLAIIRLGVRLRFRAPPLPADMPASMQWVAHASHWVLYALMFAMPLIGWAMLSAGGYPVTILHGWPLPPLVPAHGALFGWLRLAHGVLAYVFFLAILGHMGAALYHGLIRRDDVLPSMSFPRREPSPPQMSDAPATTQASAVGTALPEQPPEAQPAGDPASPGQGDAG